MSCARDLPVEADRRFKRDLEARRVQNRERQVEEEAPHAEKLRVIAAWVKTHGTPDQRACHAADLLPESEVLAVLTNEAFATGKDRPRHALDGLAHLTEHRVTSPAVPTSPFHRGTGHRGSTTTS